MKKITLILVAFWAILSVQASIDVRNFTTPQQQTDYQQLTQQLRCPQCQNNNIADSNASIAVDMRDKVFELLQQGKSKQEIVDYMVERYGNFVSYDPPVTAVTLVLWIVPALLVLVGLWVIFSKKRMKSKGSTALTAQEQQRLQHILNNKE